MLLVVLEHDRGELVEAAREALTFGRTLAGRMGSELHAALIGADDDALVAAAGEYGADTVHTCTHEVLSDYGPDAHGAVVAQMVESLSPDAVLACGSDRGNEVMAQAAARLAAPFVANCTDVVPGEPWSLTRVQWGGSLLEDATLRADVPLLTCGLHAVAAESGDGDDPDVEEFDATLDDSHTVTIVRDRVVQEAGVTLPTAPATTDDDQVGQTGTRIAPEIYIATGISGAIQHWVGAMASKHILAINTDREANMVVKADWAVIADLHDVIPAISEEVRRRRSASS